MPNPPDGSIAQSELSRALAAHGPARIEGLVNLSQKRPNFAPVWVALAEEHLRARRTEEAVQAARRALRLEPTIHTSFSGDLAHVTDDLIVKRKEMKIPEELSASALEVTARPKKKLGRAAASKPGDHALREAKMLAGYQRRDKLEELVVKYPDNAQIWLALAEETLVHRSVEKAMAAVERATQIDPSLEAMLSPPLARAWKFHQVESRVASAQARSTPDGGGVRAPGPRVNRKPYQRVGAAGAASAEPPEPEDEPARPKPKLDRMLATAMGLRSRAERIKILKQLRGMDSSNIEVLFQLAKELAMGGHADEARKCGDDLRKLSVERYTELYQWAAEYYANPQKAQEADRRKREANRGRPEPASSAQPSPPVASRPAKPQASAPARPTARPTSERREPARPTPAPVSPSARPGPSPAGPSARPAPTPANIPSRPALVPGSQQPVAVRPPSKPVERPSMSSLPTYAPPSGSSPATPGVNTAPRPPAAARPPVRRQAPARPSVSPLHDDGRGEATAQFANIREYQEERGRAASATGPKPPERDYSKENQNLKTVVMNLSEVQQLAGETRKPAATSKRPAGPAQDSSADTRKTAEQAPLYLDDGEATEVGGRPPSHAASPATHASAHASTHPSTHPAEKPARRTSSPYMAHQRTIPRHPGYQDDDEEEADTRVERREPTPQELEQHQRAQQRAQQQAQQQRRPQVPLSEQPQARAQMPQSQQSQARPQAPQSQQPQQARAQMPQSQARPQVPQSQARAQMPQSQQSQARAQMPQSQARPQMPQSQQPQARPQVPQSQQPQARPQVPLSGRSQGRPQVPLNSRTQSRPPAGRPMPAEPIAAVSSPPPYSASKSSRTIVQRRPPRHRTDSPNTQRAKLDELTLDRSTSMPPWLDSPRPWAASEHGPSGPTSPNPHSAARTRNPGEAGSRRQKSANAHPRLVRRPTTGRGPGSNDRS